MNIKSFLSLVEIRTKVASQLPLLIGTMYAIYSFNAFKPLNFILFFISLLLIDMATTALNHYYDYKRAKKRYGYNYEIHNPLSKYDLSQRTAVYTIIILLAAAVLSGLFLFLKTDLLILLLGGLSFLVGLTYSFGPVPISRTPFGEIFSGFFMGFIIFYIAVHIHLPGPEKIVNIMFENSRLLLELDILSVLYIFLASIPLIFCIANIMLANNISDIEDDKKNDRYTLPIYIGRQKSLGLFKILYFAVYFDIVLLIILGVLPVYALIILVSSIPVYHNIQTFMKKQSKKETFPVAINNFLWINSLYLLSFLLAFIF